MKNEKRKKWKNEKIEKWKNAFFKMNAQRETTLRPPLRRRCALGELSPSPIRDCGGYGIHLASAPTRFTNPSAAELSVHSTIVPGEHLHILLH